MREIKFRSWLKEKGEMLYDFTSLCHPHKPNEVNVVMQFTGLKDRVGREIYEGDVVGYWKSVRYELLVVEWSVSDGAYSFGGIRTDYAVRYGEVIGNIYENPELLEVRK